MPLDLLRDQESWGWFEVQGESAEIGPDYYKHSKLNFADIILFGQYFSCSEDQFPGLFYVIVTLSRIGMIPAHEGKYEELIAALSHYWGLYLPLRSDGWDNYNRQRGTDSRILWPPEYSGQPLFQYQDVSLTDGLVDKLERLILGPTWEPSLGPLAIRLLEQKSNDE